MTMATSSATDSKTSCSLDYWRQFFRSCEEDVFEVIEGAMAVAAADRPHDFAARKNDIAEWLFTCHQERRKTSDGSSDDGSDSDDDEEEEDAWYGSRGGGTSNANPCGCDEASSSSPSSSSDEDEDEDDDEEETEQPIPTPTTMPSSVTSQEAWKMIGDDATTMPSSADHEAEAATRAEFCGSLVWTSLYHSHLF